MAIKRYYYDMALRRKVSQEPLNRSSVETVWNNPNDERVSEFYQKKLEK